MFVRSDEVYRRRPCSPLAPPLHAEEETFLSSLSLSVVGFPLDICGISSNTTVLTTISSFRCTIFFFMLALGPIHAFVLNVCTPPRSMASDLPSKSAFKNSDPHLSSPSASGEAPVDGCGELPAASWAPGCGARRRTRPAATQRRRRTGRSPRRAAGRRRSVLRHRHACASRGRRLESPAGAAARRSMPLA